MNRFIALILTMMVSMTASVASDERDHHLDNRSTCSNRVVNCDPHVDHFETKITMTHSSSVTRLEYENTHVLLEQRWPSRGPWMTSTTQKVVFVRCGCPVPTLSTEWKDAKVFHVPVSSLMVQMPHSLHKVYLMGHRSKVAAVESSRWMSATPELSADLRDGVVRQLDRAANGQPSTRVVVSFTTGVFDREESGFRLQLTDSNMNVMAETDCIHPTVNTTSKHVADALNAAFNSFPSWVDAGRVWVLTSGDPSATPSTSLSYTLFFDKQLPATVNIQGESKTCGAEVTFKIDRDAAPPGIPIYHRLHDMSSGFPDVLITEPRSLGPLADDPTILARQFIDSDPGEATPLGRAELMKLTALLVGSVETGNSLFDLIEHRYMNARSLANKALYRPVVMLGKPGTWNEAARNSWMVTVGSTYVGEFLRDANVEYRNSDDSVNKAICGSGCGVCPSGTSDTRCSVPITDYVTLFRSADFWISAGIGANCWSDSCNFEISSDSLLDENRDIYSKFVAMQCGSVIALDKSHSRMGNAYWEVGRLRPDLILLDLVSLLHPDIEIEEETTFFRAMPPPANMTDIPPCPVTRLPSKPSRGTVHVSSIFIIELGNEPTANHIGEPHFTIQENFYPKVHRELAEVLGVDSGDLEIAISNHMPPTKDGFAIAVTVRVSGCQDHSCSLEAGQSLAILAPVIEKFLDYSWVKVRSEQTSSIVVVDHEGDRIPLVDLLEVNVPYHSEGDRLSTGAVLGIVLGALAFFACSIFLTYKFAFVEGEKQATLRFSSDGSDKISTIN